jgi:hypothetical protein
LGDAITLERIAMQPRAKINFASLEGIRKLLRAVPQRDRTPQHVSKSEAVRQLLPDIVELQGKGHDLDDIARILSDNGLPVSMWTVKNILMEAEESAKVTSAAQPPTAPRKSRGNGTPVPSDGTAARSTLVQATASEGPSSPGAKSQSKTRSESQSENQSANQSGSQYGSQSKTQSESQSKTQAATPLGAQPRELTGIPGVEADRADRENADGDAAKTLATGSASARTEAAISSAGGQAEQSTLPPAAGSEHRPDIGAERRSEEERGARSSAESGAQPTREPDSDAAARFARLSETPTHDGQANPRRRSAFTIRPDTERI